MRWLNCISWFISHLREKCDPIFKLLNKHDSGAIYYLNKKFTYYESRYPSVEKICYTLAWTVKRLWQYMLCHTTWLITILDPIKYIFEKPSLSGRIARWQVLLFEYDIQYISQIAIKGSVIAEFLAERPLEDYEPINFDFLNEDLMAVSYVEEESPEKNCGKLYFDRASNALGHGIGSALITPPTMWQNMKLVPWIYKLRLIRGSKNWKCMMIWCWSFISY